MDFVLNGVAIVYVYRLHHSEIVCSTCIFTYFAPYVGPETPDLPWVDTDLSQVRTNSLHIYATV